MRKYDARRKKGRENDATMVLVDKNKEKGKRVVYKVVCIE
jgi:hypothetical protein